MLKSRHIFIQKGSLSSNDNGRKKFNSSEIRFVDEKMLESPENYGDSLSVCMEPDVENILRQGLLDKLDAIDRALHTIKEDEKVLIYGGGELAQFFLRHADIGHLNIIGIVDRSKNPVFNIGVKDTTYENMAPADVIIITPHYAAKEIKEYLRSLNLHGRIICLSDICNGLILTGHENVWAPDLETIAGAVDYEAKKNELADVVRKVNVSSPYFVSVKSHIRYKSQIAATEKLENFEKKTALIVQGPVVYQQDFTYNSIKLYHNNFPQMKMILSVWEDDKVLEAYPDIEDYNVTLVYSAPPEIRGYQNVNLQLTTTYAGIQKAKESGCEFVFKTRTDMRFYSPDMLALMYWYRKEFPVVDTPVQKQRLVIFPPRYDYFFFIRDFFMFGHVDDMLNYWDVDRSFSNQYVGESAETMLGIRYAKYIHRFVENQLSDIEDYKKVILDVFAVVDDKLLDYVWYKYFYHKPWEHEYHYNVLNFSDWLEGQCRKEDAFVVGAEQGNDLEKASELETVENSEQKKVLFYVTDARMATRYLQTLDLSFTHLRLVRGQMKNGNILLYSDVLFINGKAIRVNIVQESDYEWADEIWFLSRDSISAAALKYVAEKWHDKLEIMDNPYVSTQKIYVNRADERFEVWNRFCETDASADTIEGVDLPFIFEPRLSALNKSQSMEYITYSLGRSDLTAGLYFDEKPIAKQKNYQAYHKDVNVIIYGKAGDKKFVEDTMTFYRSVYGDQAVAYVSVDKDKQQTLWEMIRDICNDHLCDEKKYVLIPADVRIVSPYMLKLFEALKTGYGSDRSGIVKPQRKPAEMKKAILYGQKEQLLKLPDNIQDNAWFDYIMKHMIVLDYEMLNLIDLERETYHCPDKEESICFSEWITYQVK